MFWKPKFFYGDFWPVYQGQSPSNHEAFCAIFQVNRQFLVDGHGETVFFLMVMIVIAIQLKLRKIVDVLGYKWLSVTWRKQKNTGIVNYTLPETNIAPANRPPGKEIPLGNHHFLGAFAVFFSGRVSLRVGVILPKVQNLAFQVLGIWFCCYSVLCDVVMSMTWAYRIRLFAPKWWGGGATRWGVEHQPVFTIHDRTYPWIYPPPRIPVRGQNTGWEVEIPEPQKTFNFFILVVTRFLRILGREGDRSYARCIKTRMGGFTYFLYTFIPKIGEMINFWLIFI